MSEPSTERKVYEVDGANFIHETNVNVPTFRPVEFEPSRSPRFGIATCRSPRGQAICSCGMFALRWMPHR